MSENDEKFDQLSTKIHQLVDELEDMNGILYDLAQNSTSGKKIKSARVDWSVVDDVSEQYEIWYNQAMTLITEYLPEREADFEGAYSDMDGLIHFDEAEYMKADRYCGLLRRVVSRQKNLLLSVPPKLATERLKVRKEISDEIVIEEIYQSKALWDNDNIRGAGVVAGVALERHLLTLCEESERVLEYSYSDGIRSLGEVLYDAGEITNTKKSQLGYLADIRNKCAHANEEEPDKREVERLINQSEDLFRQV